MESPSLSPQQPPLVRKPSVKARLEWHLRDLRRRLLPPVGETLPYPTVRLVYWRAEDTSIVNFGDELSKATTALMLARRGMTMFDSAPDQRTLLAIGSVLHLAPTGATIWGTGLHGGIPHEDHKYTSLDVRAVRGPNTRKFLQERGQAVPDVFGDPGLLLPRLTAGRFVADGSIGVGFVPNLHDKTFLTQTGVLDQFPEIKLIDPTRSWEAVVGDIVRCRRILASSLHGLVIADAFGIPAHYVRLTETEGLLKYHDYYAGTGRALSVSTDIGASLKSADPKPLRFDFGALEEAFPYDIWSAT